MFQTRELKLLRLALCSGAHRGEVETAAIKLIDSLRARGVKVEEFTQLAAPTHRKLDPGEVVMPFGQYKGQLIREIPEHYLVWFCREVRTHPRLVRIIIKFLSAEDVANVKQR
jgi:hypothetical protein